MILIGLILFGVSLFFVLFDIFTNKIHGKWISILILLPSTLSLLALLKTKALSYILIMLIAIGFWIWIEELYEKINNRTIDRFKTGLSRLSVFLISISLFLLFRYFLYPIMTTFLDHLKELVKTPKLISVILTFIVTYFIIVFIFGISYASLHLALNKKGFDSNHHLQLKDFFLYSAFNMATLSYKDLTPNHWLLSILTIIQVFFGIVLLGIYIAGAFTFIVK